MRPDLNINDYYYMFINQAKKNIPIYKEKYETAYNILQSCKDNLKENIDKIEALGIKLEDYPIEWGRTKYNSEEQLFNKAHGLLKKYTSGNNRILILQVVKYCSLLKHCSRHINNYDTAIHTSTIKFTEFRRLIKMFYFSVHASILNGYAYTYSYGIGDLIISRWKVSDNVKPTIDFAATNKRKKEILDAGGKLYNKNEAAWYAARGIKYDAEDYRVYRKDNFRYEVDITNSSIINSKNKEFETIQWVDKSLRGMPQSELAETFNSRGEIYNMDADIRYKLNCILHKYPTEYLKFIRNAEQSKYKRGAHNSKNRQRL